MRYKKLHFIGIGGIGMSALARLFNSKGVEVSGSDGTASDITNDLEKEGIKINIGNDSENVPEGVDAVIYTLAIGDDDSEFIRAKELNIPVFTYAEMLGQATSSFKTIAISGTHGKTSTTAMINSALRGSGMDPNMIVGSLITNDDGTKTNFVEGKDNLFVVEACEYKKSFHNLNPDILVITNIEEDHLDFYKDLDDIKDAFMVLADKVPEDGKIICDINQPNLREIIDKYSDKVVDYSTFTSELPKLKVIGDHNKANGSAALAAASVVTNNLEGAKVGLSGFKGTWRRLESHGENDNGALLYDDYAHHQTEIEVTLKAVREEFGDRNIVAFFQPHLYSRTKNFFNEFVEVLQLADEVFILSIYAAREPNDPEISSDMIVEKLNEKGTAATLLQTFEEAREEIERRDSNDLVITIGAGDISEVLG